MLDDVLRNPKEKIMEPLAKAVPGVSPTAITVLAGVVGVAAATAAAYQQYPLALGLWIANRVLDGLDGTLARVTGKQSDLGAYLDIVVDMVIYAAIPFGLALGSDLPDAFVALSLLLSSFYINGATWMFLSSLLEKRNQGANAQGQLTTVIIPRGLIEGMETFVFFSLFFIFPQWLTGLYYLMAGLVVLTSIQRVAWAIQRLKS